MASARRIGGPDAKNRVVLLDAAEQLMLDEGYAAVTSRRVAEQAELKPQLVHYYFRTMDELFLAVFRRRAEQGLAAQARGARVTAAAVGAVEIHDRSVGHQADAGVHGPGQPPQGVARRDRALRPAGPRGADQGDDRPCCSATGSTRPRFRRWCGRSSRPAHRRSWSSNAASGCPRPHRDPRGSARSRSAASRANRWPMRAARDVTSCGSSRARPSGPDW